MLSARFFRTCGAIALLGLVAMGGLFAQDVRSFGAIGNGTTDDTLAVQNAVNACPNGGTITFSPGTYPVQGLVLRPNCTYAGTGNSTVTLLAANRFIFDISGQSNIRITALALNANGIGGIVAAQGLTPAQGIQIDNCDFLNVSAAATFPANLAVASTWGIINAVIQGNRFSNVAGGIWLTTVENVSILNNSFVNVTEGDAIYVAPCPVSFQSGDNLIISGNTGANMARIAIEIFRPDPSNGGILTVPVIQNNSFSNWTGSGGMGISITAGDGALISGNTISNVTGQIQNVGIEVIVASAQVVGNNITSGFTEGIAVQGTETPAVYNNSISYVADSGIILACDTMHNRCASNYALITGNTIINAQLIGIKLDNDWSNSLISRNTITRTAGFWPQDSFVLFSGIHQSPARGPGVIDSNAVIQDATLAPNGFAFAGVRLNSSMPGSSVTNNVVRSLTSSPFGSGILDNTGSAINGWIVTGNMGINTVN